MTQVATDASKQDYSAILSSIADAIVLHSEGRIRLAFNEKDRTSECDPEAAHFLKLNEVRLGRDLEVYKFMGRMMGWEFPILHFLEEVVLPLKSNAHESYTKASEALRELGEKLFPEERLADWRAIFE